MSTDKRARFVLVLLCALGWLASPSSVLGQSQAGSSRFGAGSSSTSSTAGARASARSVGSGGSSSWGAGKGSFGNSAQSGGIWRDGSTLSPALSSPHQKTEVRDTLGAPRSSARIATTRSSGTRATGVRGIGASSPAHLSRPGLGAGTARKTSGFGHSAGRSRSRVGSTGKRAKNVEGLESSGLATRLGHPGLFKTPAASASPHTGLGTQGSK